MTRRRPRSPRDGVGRRSGDRALRGTSVRRWGARGSVLGGLLVVTACGSRELPPSSFDSLPPPQTAPDDFGSDADDPLTTDPASSTTPRSSRDGIDTGGGADDAAVITEPQPLATAADWVDVTGNLAGLESTCGNVSYVSAHPATGLVMAGIAAQGLWALDEDDGGEWSSLGAGGGSDPIVNRTSWIEYDPLDEDRFWESGAYGEGAFRTDDGGETFERLGDLRHLDHVSVDLTDDDRSTLLAGGHETRAIHLSTDGGRTWDEISDPLPADVGFTAFPIVLDDSTFLVGTYRGSDAGIYRTTDRGETWEQVHDVPISGPPVVVDDTIYWLQSQGGGVAVSADGGEEFNALGVPTGGRPSTLRLLPDGRLLTHDASSLLLSDDGGESWQPFGPPLPFEPRGVTSSAARGALYVWQFTCNFGDEGNPVLPESIMELDLLEPIGEPDAP